MANCTQVATGESLKFCYETKTTPDSIPFLCKPLWSRKHSRVVAPSNATNNSLPGGERCRIVLVSSAVWGPTMPLHVVIVAGIQTPPLPEEELQLSLITPSCKNITRSLVNWEPLNWTVAGHDMIQQGPPDWVVPLQGTRCDKLTPTIRFKFYGHLSISEGLYESGLYTLELGPQPKTVLKFDPLIINLAPLQHLKAPISGPHVLKLDQQEHLVAQPRISLKELQIQLEGMNISHIAPVCAPLIGASHRGWGEWVKMWQGINHVNRVKRELKDWLAPVGTGISLVDAANIEVLANKLSYATENMGNMGIPLTSSLKQLSEEQQLISKVFPGWEKLIEKDEESIISGVQSLQNNISLTFACEQAQALTQNVIMGMIRQALVGQIPMEVINLIRPHVTDEELVLQPWWRLVNASYNHDKQSLQLFLITVAGKEIRVIHPVVPLGLQINDDSVMYSKDPNTWAWQKDNVWNTVNVKGCRRREGLGYICEDQALEEHDECFFPQPGNESHCSFDVIQEEGSVIVYIGKACVCVRTRCSIVLINGYWIQPMVPYINRCFCNVTTIVTCDSKFTVPIWTVQHLKAYPELYKEISPIILGMGLNVIKGLLNHPSLQLELQKLQTLGEKGKLEIRHYNQEISRLAVTVADTGHYSWWEIFHEWSPSA
uniref:Uncharacterized protein n=1 Tax=Pelodiscus sinensis TaxID=13735 RepID=K7EZ49_PELSI